MYFVYLIILFLVYIISVSGTHYFLIVIILLSTNDIGSIKSALLIQMMRCTVRNCS